MREPAVAELYRKIQKFVARRVGNPSDREDLVQDIFLKMKTSLPQLRHQDRLLPWLYRSAYHRIVDYYRLRNRKTLPLEPSVPQAEAENRNAEVSSWLVPFIRQMNREDREILKLIEFEGKTQGEAARLLGLSLPAAKSRHQRAKQRLRKRLQACCDFRLDSRNNITDYRSRNSACRCRETSGLLT